MMDSGTMLKDSTLEFDDLYLNSSYEKLGKLQNEYNSTTNSKI